MSGSVADSASALIREKKAVLVTIGQVAFLVFLAALLVICVHLVFTLVGV